MPVQRSVLPASSSKTIVEGTTGLIVAPALVDPLVKRNRSTADERIQGIAHFGSINAAGSSFSGNVPNIAKLCERRE